MLFTDTDRDRIAGAIAAAEAGTAGEIVVIVSTSTHRYSATALSVAALLALALPLLALLMGWSPAALFANWDDAARVGSERHSLEIFILLQALVFVAVLAMLHYTALNRILTPPGLRRDRVHRAALTQFKARALDATLGRTGVLIYIDEPEHIAEVIADTGIYANVSPEHWGTTISALTSGIATGDPAGGMVKAIGLAGGVLAEHFPRLPDDVNELADRLIEI